MKLECVALKCRETNNAWPKIFTKLICNMAMAIAVKLTVVRQAVPVEKPLMASSCVCQAKTTVASARHEKDWHILKSVVIRREKWKDASCDYVKMTEITIKLQRVAPWFMIFPAQSQIHEQIRPIGHSVIKQRRYVQSFTKLVNE